MTYKWASIGGFPSITVLQGGWFVWPPVIKCKERNLTKWWDLDETCKRNLLDEKILFNYHFWKCATKITFEIRIKKFEIFSSMDPLTQDKASVVVMATLALCNFLRLKWRDSYTPKGSADELQRIIVTSCMAWKLLVKKPNCSGQSRYKKTKFKRQKNSNIVIGICPWSRTTRLVFEDSNRVIKFKTCADNLSSLSKM